MRNETIWYDNIWKRKALTSELYYDINTSKTGMDTVFTEDGLLFHKLIQTTVYVT